MRRTSPDGAPASGSATLLAGTSAGEEEHASEMSETSYERVIGGEHAVAEPDAFTRLDYARRAQPERESGMETLGALLCAFGIVFGILAFIHPFMPSGTIAFPSLKYGMVGVILSIVGAAMIGKRDEMGRYALTISTLGFLLGTTICVLLTKSAY